MPSGRNVGVTVTLGDDHLPRDLDVDFFEVPVREGDDPRRPEGFLAGEERAAIVHAPERMRIGGRSDLIDLADPDPKRREAFAARIGEVAAAAERHGAATVVHPGGVREAPEERGEMPRRLVEPLRSIGGTLWIENMPRRYHAGKDLLYCNLLRHPGEFRDVLPHVDGVALDISHAYLSVDKGGSSAIGAFFGRLKGHIRHVHMSDASYPNNEGLQLGDGHIDFAALPRPGRTPVLLEVRGGHLNGGEGYRLALERSHRGASSRAAFPERALRFRRTAAAGLAF